MGLGGDTVELVYTNYKGEKSIRKVLPVHIWFGETVWHPDLQWFLDAWDVDRQAMRSFAMVAVDSWKICG